MGMSRKFLVYFAVIRDVMDEFKKIITNEGSKGGGKTFPPWTSECSHPTFLH